MLHQLTEIERVDSNILQLRIRVTAYKENERDKMEKRVGGSTLEFEVFDHQENYLNKVL